MTIQFTSVVPILRIFDVAKADEFYQGFLGFKVGLGSPLRRQRAALPASVARRPHPALKRAPR
jgi:hypothetical protein